MDAVNFMQDEMARRESELELNRQQSFHKEKMAAVGSLAAAVAHEINNPLSAIVGVAQAMDSECKSTTCASYGTNCHPEMILKQATRVMQITRQISEFSVPQSQEAELTDLNGLLRSTANFVKFDRRFRLIEVSLELDGNLPAVVLVADHMVQVAMNLLINAGDALSEIQGRPPLIRIVTRIDGDWVSALIVDNGPGIPEAILPRVFEERFSTKGPGRGSGLGLSVCRSLVERAGGEIPQKHKKYSNRITKAIIKESKLYGIDPVFIASIIQTESSFNPEARGLAGEIGLMQLMPSTAKEVAERLKIKWRGPKTLLDPVNNIRIGAAYISQLRGFFENKPYRYMAAYNIGPGKILKIENSKDVPKFYSANVMKYYEQFYKKVAIIQVPDYLAAN